MENFRQNIIDFQFKQREYRRYYNSTSGILEEIGFETQGNVNPEGCSVFYTSQVTSDVHMTKEEHLIAKYVLGCIKCRSGFISQIERNTRTRVDMQTCRPFQNVTAPSLASQDTECDNNSVWWPRKAELIDEDMSVDLVCTQCSQLIPNCLSCANSRTCQVCVPPMRLVTLVDSEGYSNTVCMDRCRFKGRGDECEQEPTLENCVQSE